MHSIQRSAIVPFSARQMYELVANVDEYRDFLPWCRDSEVLERAGDTVVARVEIDFKGIRRGFVTENRNAAGERIDLTLKDGPFRRLAGTWRFEPLGEDGSRVSLDLEFEFAGVVMERAMGPVFRSIAGSLVDSFVKRAQRVYGRRGLDLG